MNQKSDLEKYVEYGIAGVPEIKGSEKRYWLGEFRERVILALTFEQIYRKEALKVVEEKCKDKRVDKIILEDNVQSTVAEKFMELASKYDKDYKMIDTQNKLGEIALVLASNEAVDEKDVLIKQMPILPDIFYNAKNKKLCKKHMQMLKEEAPLFVDEFQEITFLDRVMGVKCGVCDKID
ncbi:DUF1694 domain-containing protein [Crassaminicella thermophila]|uniref:DUF1694 domain-containing protein n=1 Tax=Crassaminicella thermophila TaxID=2599308 RepID=A0A5C0SIF0_CRATE|nr:YueI family protein [Crassaminicella thermophila]QEK13214.1 DUF1694 domain-containing protein [Crassaminicella thermophila]